MKLRGLIFIAFAALSSCAPMRFVRPLEKKQQAAGISIGGQLIRYHSLTVPVPFLVAGYGYGIDSALTGFATLNVTSALFGNAHLNLGVTRQLLRQKNYFPEIGRAHV